MVVRGGQAFEAIMKVFALHEKGGGEDAVVALICAVVVFLHCCH